LLVATSRVRVVRGPRAGTGTNDSGGNPLFRAVSHLAVEEPCQDGAALRAGSLPK